MTDLDKLDELVQELYLFTASMTKENMNEILANIVDRVIEKREERDELNEEYPHFLFTLANGIASETDVASQMMTAGHGHRWPEVQALGREMYNINHPSSQPLSPVQPSAVFNPCPPSPSPMGVPLASSLFPNPPMPLPVPPMAPGMSPVPAGHTPCVVRTLPTGEKIFTPIAPSPSPSPFGLLRPSLDEHGVLPPMLPFVMPGGMGFTGEPMLDDLPELEFNRSKSVPQGTGLALKINVMQDSIKAPSLDPLPLGGPLGGGARPRSRSRSRDRSDDVDLPLPTGPSSKDKRSSSRGRRDKSRDRNKSHERELMPARVDSGLRVPLSGLGQRSNSMPTLSNRKSSSRRRRRRQPTKRELAEAKLRELGDRYGPRFTRTGMRGENVLRLKAKTKRALQNIVPFIDFLDERITLEEISCPLSRPSKEQKQRGFLAYLKTKTVAEAKEVHDSLFHHYCGQNLDHDGKPPFKLIELNPMAKYMKLQMEQEQTRQAGGFAGGTQI